MVNGQGSGLTVSDKVGVLIYCTYRLVVIRIRMAFATKQETLLDIDRQLEITQLLLNNIKDDD